MVKNYSLEERAAIWYELWNAYDKTFELEKECINQEVYEAIPRLYECREIVLEDLRYFVCAEWNYESKKKINYVYRKVLKYRGEINEPKEQARRMLPPHSN